mgnify:CR=1 FL=1
MRARTHIPFLQRLRSQVRYSVPIKNIRTPFGEPFNEDNHWVRTIAEYEAGMTDFRKSSLYAFHQGFQPTTILDVVEDGALHSTIPPALGSYPWGKWTCRYGPQEWQHSRHCGPSSDELICKEWRDFTSLFEKIRFEGFNCKRYGHLLGLFFVSDANTKFFIVLGGNHRAAIASALGLEDLQVRLLPRSYLTRQKISFHDISHDPLSKLIFKNIVSEEFLNWRDDKDE